VSPERRAPDVGAAAQTTLFIDRDIWSRVLDAALRAAGIPFIAHRDVFADDTPDEQWLAAIAAKGWVVVTRDQRIRNRANELAAVRRAALHLFAMTSGNLAAAETARIVIAAGPRIQAAVRETAPPMMWSITRAGDVRAIKR
jgi:predicted nuclease of predicted toxin-antitoxin system